MKQFFATYNKHDFDPITDEHLLVDHWLEHINKRTPLAPFPDLLKAILLSRTPGPSIPLGFVQIFLSDALKPEHDIILDYFEEGLFDLTFYPWSGTEGSDEMKKYGEWVIKWLGVIQTREYRKEIFFKKFHQAKFLSWLDLETAQGIRELRTSFRSEIAQAIVSKIKTLNRIDLTDLAALSNFYDHLYPIEKLNLPHDLFFKTVSAFLSGLLERSHNTDLSKHLTKDVLNEDFLEKNYFLKIVSLAAHVFEKTPERFFELLEISVKRKNMVQIQFDGAAYDDRIVEHKVWMLLGDRIHKIPVKFLGNSNFFWSGNLFPQSLFENLISFLSQKSAEQTMKPVGTSEFWGFGTSAGFWSEVLRIEQKQGRTPILSGQSFFYLYYSLLKSDERLEQSESNLALVNLDFNLGPTMTEKQKGILEKEGFLEDRHFDHSQSRSTLVDTELLVLTSLKIKYLLERPEFSIDLWQHTLSPVVGIDLFEPHDKLVNFEASPRRGDFQKALAYLWQRPEKQEVFGLFRNILYSQPAALDVFFSTLEQIPPKDKAEFLEFLLPFWSLGNSLVHHSGLGHVVKNFDFFIFALASDLTTEDFNRVFSKHLSFELAERLNGLMGEQIKDNGAFSSNLSFYASALSNRIFLENLLNPNPELEKVQGYFTGSYQKIWASLRSHPNYPFLLANNPEKFLTTVKQFPERWIYMPKHSYYWADPLIALEKSVPTSASDKAVAEDFFNQWQQCSEEYLKSLPDDFFLKNFVLNPNADAFVFKNFILTCGTSSDLNRFIRSILNLQFYTKESAVKTLEFLALLAGKLRGPLKLEPRQLEILTQILGTHAPVIFPQKTPLPSITALLDFRGLGNSDFYKRNLYIVLDASIADFNLLNQTGRGFFDQISDVSRTLFSNEELNLNLDHNNSFFEYLVLLQLSKRPMPDANKFSSGENEVFLAMAKAENLLDELEQLQLPKEKIVNGFKLFIKNFPQSGRFPSQKHAEDDFQAFLRIAEDLGLESQDFFYFVCSRYGSENFRRFVSLIKDRSYEDPLPRFENWTTGNLAQDFKSLLLFAASSPDFDNLPGVEFSLSEFKRNLSPNDYLSLGDELGRFFSSPLWAKLSEAQQAGVRKMGLEILGSLVLGATDSASEESQKHLKEVKDQFDFHLGGNEKLSDQGPRFWVQQIFEKAREFQIASIWQVNPSNRRRLYDFVLATEAYFDLLERDQKILSEIIEEMPDPRDRENFRKWREYYYFNKKLQKDLQKQNTEILNKVGFEKYEEFRRQYPIDKTLSYLFFTKLFEEK